MNHSNSIFSNLTNHLIIEILLRLPVKSLVRFCSVCKSWKTLIRSDGFIKSHLKQSLQSNPSTFNNVRIYSETEFMKNHIRGFFSGSHFVFVGCSNGVLCYYTKIWTSYSIIVHLWNPATRRFRPLPGDSCRSNYLDKVIVKFLFDPANDDYKVVKIHHHNRIHDAWRLQNSPVVEGEVYSLSTNSWKTINLSSFPMERLVGSNIVAHNGALHCITTSVPDSSHRAVLGVFDIDEEIFDEVSLPDCEFKTKPMPSLGPFKEFLSLSVWREDFEVWMMKEYGVWTKQVVLVNSPDFHSPYGTTASGKILAFNWQGEEVLCDAESKTIEKFVKNKVVFIKAKINDSEPDMDHVVAADYVESLISPHPPAETRETTNN